MRIAILGLALIATAASASDDHLIAECGRGKMPACEELERKRVDQLRRIESELKQQREAAERREHLCSGRVGRSKTERDRC